MARQSDKPQTIKTTNPQSVELAGTIGSTSETFTGESRGRYALSTSSSTTIVNAQTLYPELWNRAPAGWQSGSDLVVPPQGNSENIETVATVTWKDHVNTTSEASTSVALVKTGRLVTASGRVKLNPTSSTGVEIRFAASDLPYANSGFRLQGRISRDTFPNAPNSGFITLHQNGSDVIFRLDGAISNTGDLFYTFLFQYHTVNADTNITGTTPYIHLYDNVSSGALGLPEATADVSGIVTTGTQTFAGNKTFTGIIAPNGGWSTAGGGAASDSASGLVTTGTQTFAGDKTFTGDISANTISANGTIGASNLNNGSWSPGLYSITNCSVTSSSNEFYQRVGNMVTCWLLVTVTVTTPGLVEFDFSLPVGSVSSYTKINGTGYRTSNTVDQGVVRLGSTVSRGRFNITSTATGSRSFNIVFSYYLT